MTLFIGIITTISFLAVRASAEISGKRYKDKDEGRLIMMSFFIILAVIAVLFSLIFIGSGLWDVVIAGFFIALFCSMAAYILYYRTGRE